MTKTNVSKALRARLGSRARWTMALIITSIGASGCLMSTPPESEYTQAEAYAPLEQAVADTVAVLPDFPGFSFRSWDSLPCSRNGVDDPDYVNVEISYHLPEEVRSDALYRETYADVLREHWSELGYEVREDHRTELSTGRVDRILTFEREDGITLAYIVARVVGFKMQSGCVPVSDASEIEYIPPAGGIEPGSDGDAVTNSGLFLDGIPSEFLTGEASPRGD